MPPPGPPADRRWSARAESLTPFLAMEILERAAELLEETEGVDVRVMGTNVKH